jgi:hypothetical protein
MEQIDLLWRPAVSALCGGLLLAVIVALIADFRGFRRDLVAVEGEIKLGPLSAQGVAVLVLCAMLLSGLVYPLYLAEGNKSTPDPTLSAKVEQLEEELKNRIAKDGVPDFIEGLGSTDKLAVEILAIAEAGKGPWNPLQESKDAVVSVPGGLKRQGKVFGCPELYKKTVHLFSPEGAAETIEVRVNGLMMLASNCREIAQVDLQLDCQTANHLFSDSFLECDGELNPLWSPNVKQKDHKLSVQMVVTEAD